MQFGLSGRDLLIQLVNEFFVFGQSAAHHPACPEYIMLAHVFAHKPFAVILRFGVDRKGVWYVEVVEIFFFATENSRRRDVNATSVDFVGGPRYVFRP